MARTPILVSRCSITTLILILNNTLVNSNCFSIRLIHPYSPESPLFESNLTHVQRIKSLVSQSKIRAYNLAKTRNWSSIIQAPIDVQVFLYIVKLGIGTFKSKPSYKEYYLVMDTGSDLLWMQCEGCTNCFEQTPRPFPKDNSSSFRPVLVENKPSHYEFVYEDGDGTQGILARETFYLRSNNGGLVKIKDVEFGCGLKNDVKYRSYKNKIAEITGLGWQDLSFVQQISPQINGKFSYCLPVLLSGNTSNTYLRFGDQKIQTKNSKTTPLYRKKDISTYHVQLQGISVNGTKLKINPKVFMFNTNDSSGGCIIDSGTPHSRIISPAFYLLKLELKNHFWRMKAFKKIKVDFGKSKLISDSNYATE